MSETEVKLLDESGDVTEEFEKVLKDIFAAFDKDQDKVLNDAELNAYSTFLNGAPFGDEELEQMRDFFDCDEKGSLTFSGFLQLYQMQTSGDEQETWKDLTKHGYDKSLKKATKPTADSETKGK
eukprot:Colp12_sorted_trinity150504_noHs@11163